MYPEMGLGCNHRFDPSNDGRDVANHSTDGNH